MSAEQADATIRSKQYVALLVVVAVLIPGLLAAGIGTLVSLGMGHFTGLSTSAYAIGPLQLSTAPRPAVGEFGWTIALALAIGVVTSLIMRGGLRTYRFVSRRQLLVSCPRSD
jgi:hypothetical protein